MINLREMHSHTEIQMGESILYSEFFSALQRAIKRVNIRAEKETKIVKISGTQDWGYTIDADPTIISDDIRVIGSGRWGTGITWDAINYAIAMPREYCRIIDVYCDGVKLPCYPYDVMKDRAGYELCYASASNHIYFSRDINSDSTEIVLRARTDYLMPQITDIEYLSMQDSSESMLIDGILSILYEQPKHFNDRLVYIYKKRFEDEIDMHSMNILTQDKQVSQAAKYTY